MTENVEIVGDKHKNTVQDNSLTSANARAARCLLLRDMMGLSREAVRLRYGIARGTLQNWESARFGGLTQKGAKIIITASRAEGIDVSMQWLLYGIGTEPRFSSAVDTEIVNNKKLVVSDQDMQNVSKMLNTFRAHHPDCIDMLIQDDAMSPLFNPGEYVAGNRKYLSDIEGVVGLQCIVQTQDYGNLLRYLKLGDEINLYHLISLNHDSTVSQATLYNVPIISAAPVIWRYKVTK